MFESQGLKPLSLLTIVRTVLLWALIIAVLLYPFVFRPQSPPSITAPETGYEPVPDFASYQQVTHKKRAFFNYLAPAVHKQNQVISQQRHFLLALQAQVSRGFPLSSSQKQQLLKIAQQYQVDTQQVISQQLSILLERVDVIPLEMILVQTANESAWGTSRFAQQGFNFFGLWCFKPGCGFVPKRRNAGASHEVAKFTDLDSAMAKYMTNLNRHPAYQELRDIRSSLRSHQHPITAAALIQGLTRYSERGEAYVEELLAMLATNKKYMPLE